MMKQAVETVIYAGATELKQSGNQRNEYFGELKRSKNSRREFHTDGKRLEVTTLHT